MTFISQKSINICSDPILRNCLAQQGIDAHVFDTILSREEKTGMLESLERFASNWFLTEEGVDYTEYRNVSIGAALHDEVMTLFHLLIHFVFVIDKLESKNEIIFYHSTSCLMPDVVIEFLSWSNVTIKLVDEKYPWLCYKKQFDSNCKGNVIRIPFNIQKRKDFELRSKLGELKLFIRRSISRISCAKRKRPNRYIYFQAIRSLLPFYRSYMKRKDNQFCMYISDTTPLDPDVNKRKKNFFTDICQLIHLGRKGVILDSLRCPFYFKWYVQYKKSQAYKNMITNFRGVFPENVKKYLNVKNKVSLNFIIKIFERFWLRYLHKFIKSIDFQYNKVAKQKPILCLNELWHPFQVQVYSNMGIPYHIFPTNHIVHNQYVAPLFLKKTKKVIKLLAFSELDAKRYLNMGFERENLIILNMSYFMHWDKKIKKYHKINILRGGEILLLPPGPILLLAFTNVLESNFLLNYFRVAFEVLNELGVSSVTVRPRPSGNVALNQFGHTHDDLYRYLMDNADYVKANFEIKLRDSSSYDTFEEDVLDNEIIIGSLSGALFEVLMLGRDYIFYDDLINIYDGDKYWTIYNEGNLKQLRTKEELRNHLVNYISSDIEGLRGRLVGNEVNANYKDLLQLYQEKFL